MFLNLQFKNIFSTHDFSSGKYRDTSRKKQINLPFRKHSHIIQRIERAKDASRERVLERAQKEKSGQTVEGVGDTFINSHL